jgi:hypothetical protein
MPGLEFLNDPWALVCPLSQASIWNIHMSVKKTLPVKSAGY